MAARPAGLVAGIACGVGAALMWAGGFVAAQHGIRSGLTPFDLMLHRYVWAGFAFLPSVVSHGLRDLDGVGWGRGIALAVLGGPGLAVVSASGFLLVPLGHGGVIQPSCAALAGMFLAAAVLREHLPRVRVYGALVIVIGLAVIGGEAIATIGTHGLLGDLAFATAGVMFAFFAILLRLWRIYPMRATAVVSVLTLGYVPVHAAVFGFGTMIRAGFAENALQAVAQGVFSGPTAIYLFARSVELLGASRAAVFPSLVPGFTLLVGYLAIGEVPTIAQVVGFAIVLLGFRLTQKA
jgi:drug/metabolite transporter (DMT)-like permease